MKNVKIIIALLLAAVMLLSLAACGGTDTEEENGGENTAEGGDSGVKTTAGTKSFAASVSSGGYKLKEPLAFSVTTGTSLEDVLAEFPSSIGVLTEGTATGMSTVLFHEDFDSEASVEENWDLYLPSEGYTIAEGKIAIEKNDTNTKMCVTGEEEWMMFDTDDYANYAVKAVLRGTADTPDNNFGLIFRASDVTYAGPDSYYGLYVGLGDESGQICVGYAQNNWNSLGNIDIDYEANRDYTLEVLVYNETFVILLDGEVMGEYDAQGFMNGTVGIRTYKQLFEVSEFEVRTLGASDFDNFESGYSEYVDHPVTWACSDYDPDTKGRYGFIGTVTDLDGVQCKVIVTVKG